MTEQGGSVTSADYGDLREHITAALTADRERFDRLVAEARAELERPR